MLLEHKFVSAPYYVDTADGVRVSLHVALGCFNYRWHHDIVKLFYLFLWGGTLSYVALGTVSL